MRLLVFELVTNYLVQVLAERARLVVALIARYAATQQWWSASFR